jgi:hypothetical protein
MRRHLDGRWFLRYTCATHAAFPEQSDLAMSRVRAFASMVAEQVNPAKTRRTLRLRILRCFCDVHGRDDAARDGLA